MVLKPLFELVLHFLYFSIVSLQLHQTLVIQFQLGLAPAVGVEH